MGELIYCRGELASLPFYIEESGVNLFSVEEVSYYILHNLYFLDRELYGEELCNWIALECKDEELAEKLRHLYKSDGDSYPFFMTILMESGYCKKDELQLADRVLKDLQHRSYFEKKKLRSDYYLQNRKYARAILEYTQLLQSDEAKKEDKTVLSKVYHNLGVAYMRMFCYEEGLDCFQKAYGYVEREETNRAILLCEDLLQGRISEEWKESEDFSAKMEEADHLLQMKDAEGFETFIFDLLLEWKKEYRKYSQT